MKQLRPVTRSRLIRAYISATVSSEITVQEMLTLSEELAYGRFGHDLSDILRNLAKSLQTRLKDAELEPVDDAVEEALSIINTRRLPKHRVFDLMHIVDSDAAPEEFATKQSLRTVLKRFFRMTPEASGRNLIHLLSSNASGDEYLNHIDRNKG